jgi:hypothetical protein
MVSANLLLVTPPPPKNSDEVQAEMNSAAQPTDKEINQEEYGDADMNAEDGGWQQVYNLMISMSRWCWD